MDGYARVRAPRYITPCLLLVGSYSSLNHVGSAAHPRYQAPSMIGITYETGDPGCSDKASACRIEYRTLSLALQQLDEYGALS